MTSSLNYGLLCFGFVHCYTTGLSGQLTNCTTTTGTTVPSMQMEIADITPCLLLCVYVLARTINEKEDKVNIRFSSSNGPYNNHRISAFRQRYKHTLTISNAGDKNAHLIESNFNE